MISRIYSLCIHLTFNTLLVMYFYFDKMWLSWISQFMRINTHHFWTYRTMMIEIHRYPIFDWNNYFVKYQEWIQNSLGMCQKCCIRGCFVVVDNIALSDSVDACWFVSLFISTYSISNTIHTSIDSTFFDFLCVLLNRIKGIWVSLILIFR